MPVIIRTLACHLSLTSKISCWGSFGTHCWWHPFHVFISSVTTSIKLLTWPSEPQITRFSLAPCATSARTDTCHSQRFIPYLPRARLNPISLTYAINLYIIKTKNTYRFIPVKLFYLVVTKSITGSSSALNILPLASHTRDPFPMLGSLTSVMTT